jgi:hypothetical protein
MGSDLAGMGAGNFNFYENEMMVRQPTAMISDPAMMTGPIQAPVIQAPAQPLHQPQV